MANEDTRISRGIKGFANDVKKINAYYEIWILMDLEKPMEGSSFTKNIPIKSFKEILDGKYDDKSEQAFYMKGSIDQVQ